MENSMTDPIVIARFYCKWNRLKRDATSPQLACYLLSGDPELTVLAVNAGWMVRSEARRITAMEEMLAVWDQRWEAAK